MARQQYTRRAFTLASLAGAAAVARAQIPARPIRIVLGFAAGGGSDVMMRIIAQQMTQQLGQPVVVDNRPGAEATIAADLVAKSPPDGTTLFFASNGPMVALPLVRGRPAVPYDPFKDFTPISRLGYFAMFMVTPPSVPANTIGEFLQAARGKPGGMNYASASTVSRVAGIQLLSQARADMVHVPYKGDSPALVDLMAGRVHFLFSTGAAVAGHVREGKLKALLALTDRRSPVLPDVPTAREAGLRITISPWAGLFGPAGMAAPVVERLNQALRAALATREAREQMERLGFDPAPSTPAEMAALHRDEYELFRRLVQVDGVRFD